MSKYFLKLETRFNQTPMPLLLAQMVSARTQNTEGLPEVQESELE